MDGYHHRRKLVKNIEAHVLCKGRERGEILWAHHLWGRVSEAM